MPSLSSRPLIICVSICLAVHMETNCSLADISFETDIVAETYTISNIRTHFGSSLFLCAVRWQTTTAAAQGA